MKLRISVLLALVSFSVQAYGHTEIFFPKVFSPSELPTSGFVLLNPDPFTATVDILLVSTAGSPISSTRITIPPGGQFARLGSDLFPNVNRSGWVYVLNDTEGMQAFWLTYNSDVTSMDGAPAVSYDAIGADQIIPLVAGQTELNVINPNFLTLSVTIRIFGTNGALAPAVTRSLPVAGALQSPVSDLFPGVEIAQARYLRIGTDNATIASSAVIRGYLVPTESLVINGFNVTTRSQMTFPHVINGLLGNASYTTEIGITNTSSAPQTVTITFNSDAGDTVTVTRAISAGGSLREPVNTLFDLPPTFRSGWVTVTGTASLTGFAGYADRTAGGVAVVPAATAQAKQFFSHIANGPPQWQTGIALLNATDRRATVEVFAMNPDGKLIGGPSNASTSRFALEPGTKISKVIDEVIPQTAGVNGGFVFVSSDVPLNGIELFYTRDLKVLSNVAAAPLVSGVLYKPPAP